MQRIVLLFSFSVFIGYLKAQQLDEKANYFLSTLTPGLKAETVFTFGDLERFNMNYVPVERRGPSFHDFNAEQKKAALDLLSSSLSKQGYHKANDIMELENVLQIIEENQLKNPDGTPMRDPLDYHICIFGDPSIDDIWGWRFEGHHLSLNFTSNEEKIISSTPTFWGSNPAIVKTGAQKGKEILKLETDLGFKLINSLSADQLKVARFSKEAPNAIITGNKRKVENLVLQGIPYTSLTATQQQTLVELLNVYIDNYESGFEKTLKTKIEFAGIEKLYFGWAGSLSPGAGHYYRIQGPTILIEYDNAQNEANHIHSVVRDLTNDYGEDILRVHYKKEH